MVRSTFRLSVVIVAFACVSSMSVIAAAASAETTETDTHCIPLEELTQSQEPVIPDLIEQSEPGEISEVANPVAGHGGADAEAPGLVLKREPKELRDRGRDDQAEDLRIIIVNELPHVDRSLDPGEQGDDVKVVLCDSDEFDVSEKGG